MGRAEFQSRTTKASSSSIMSDSLFACTLCHNRFRYEELSKNDQHCKKCRKTRVVKWCSYCTIEFRGDSRKDSVCSSCTQSLKAFGEPTTCEYCNLKAAFHGGKCNHCTHYEKKFGLPVVCDNCRLRCAFNKLPSSKAKVGGRTLCFSCTRSYKRNQYESKRAKRDPVSVVESERPIVPEPYTCDHMKEITALREEIDRLKKQVKEKDKMLLEKEKKITELKASHWEMEKDVRQKSESTRKDLLDQIEELQKETSHLKKRISISGKTPKPTKDTSLMSQLF